MVGITATRLNRIRRRRWRREPARPRRRSAHTCTSRQATMAQSGSTRMRLSSRKSWSMSGRLGPKGGRPRNAAYVARADAIAAIASAITVLRTSRTRRAQSTSSSRDTLIRVPARRFPRSVARLSHHFRPLPRVMSNARKRRAAYGIAASRRKPWQVAAGRPPRALLQVAGDVDIELADLLAEGVAVEAQELGRFELVAPGGTEAQQDERPLDLAQYAVIEPGGRQAALMRGKIVLEMALGGTAKPLIGCRLGRNRRGRRLGELGLDGVDADDLLGIESGKAPHHVLELAHIAGPAIALEPLHRRAIERFHRQPLGMRLGEEMPHQRRNVLGALAQGRQADRHDVEA